jgi:hypothetical protein
MNDGVSIPSSHFELFVAAFSAEPLKSVPALDKRFGFRVDEGVVAKPIIRIPSFRSF